MINYLILLVILFSMAISIFAIFVILNDFIINKLITKFKINKKYIWKCTFIRICQYIFIFVSLFFLIILPQFSLFKNNVFIISIFYIPIILIIGILFNIWLPIMLSLSLFIGIIINNALLSKNQYDFFINTMFQLLIIFICIGTVILNNFFNKKNSKLINFIFSSIFMLIISIMNIVFFIEKIQLMFWMIIQIIAIWISYLLMYEISKLYQQFSKKIQSINDIRIYDNQYFFNSNLAQSQIQKIIKQENSSFGVMILFDLINFNTLHPIWGNSGAKFIQKKILKEIVNSFKNLNTIFFMTSENEYACFVTLNNFNNQNLKEIYIGNNKQIRSFNDPVKQIQNAMLNIPRNVFYKNNSKKIIAGAYGSIYGIHSNDITQLINLCYKTKQKSYSSRRTNILYVYDPNKIHIGNKIKEINYQNHYFQPNNFQINLINKKNVLLSNKDYYILDVCYLDRLLIGLDNIKSFATSMNVYEHTIRMIAMQALKIYSNISTPIKSKKNPIILDYPINYVISENFNLGNFKNKLETLNVDIDNIIFKFDLDNFSNIDAEFYNLNSLQKMGLKFIFNNLNINNISILEKIQPNFVKFKKNELNFSNQSNIHEIKQLLKSMNVILIN